MKKTIIYSMALIIGISGIFITSFAKVPPQVLQSSRTSLSPMLKKTMPAVVNIVTRGDLPFLNDPFLKRELEQSKKYDPLKDKYFASIGSGVIVDAKDGLIVTNAHVVDYAKMITVTLNDGRHYPAKTIGADNDSDIALLKIDAKNLTKIPIGDSDNVNVGDFVAAIGSPFGLNQTVTSGIVSAVHRGDLGIEGLENFIQTDAPINVGNSGGALVNMNGELIGINTALISSNGGNIGIGFAIPSNMVNSVIEQILKYGEVRRGLMGVIVQTLTPDLASAFNAPNATGAVITQIVPNSPAAKVGLKIGDIITAINGASVKSNIDVQSLVGLTPVGGSLKLSIMRNGKPYTIVAPTGDPKTTETSNEAANPYLYGVDMQEIIGFHSIFGRISGVAIVQIKPYSPAAIAGLLPGDIIIAANHEATPNLKKLMQLARLNKQGLLLNILRNEGAAFVVIK